MYYYLTVNLCLRLLLRYTNTAHSNLGPKRQQDFILPSPVDQGLFTITWMTNNLIEKIMECTFKQFKSSTLYKITLVVFKCNANFTLNDLNNKRKG